MSVYESSITLQFHVSLCRLRYQLISCLVTVLLAWGVTVSGGRWIAAAALALVILVVCGCVAMATKQVCRAYHPALCCFQSNLGGGWELVSFPDCFSVAGNEYVLYTSVCQWPSLWYRCIAEVWRRCRKQCRIFQCTTQNLSRCLLCWHKPFDLFKKQRLFHMATVGM